LEKTHIENELQDLFDQPLDVLAIGLDTFAAELAKQEVQVTLLDWKPPADGDAELADLLSRLGC